LSDRIPSDLKSLRGTTFLTLLVVGPAVVGVACATAPEPEVSADELESMEHRVEDVERTNGRLTVRVEEMERQMSLVQDRVQSNRIALQRHGYLGGRGDRFARAQGGDDEADGSQRPEPAPESHYRESDESQTEEDSGYSADPSMDQRIEQRGMRRIPLSDQQSGREHQPQETTEPRDLGGDTQPEQESVEAPDGDQLDYDPGSDIDSDTDTDSGDDGDSSQDEQGELVITNESLEQRFGPSTTSSTSPSADEGSDDGGDDSQSEAHVPVTSERLPTTDELSDDPDVEPDVDGEEVAEQPVSEDDEESSDDAGQWADASDDELLELYQDSLAEYRAGDYAEALQGFEQFLAAEPVDEYVDNAMYWIGECHYGLGRYETSVDYFQRILDEVPDGNKVPDAMLKMSLAYEQLGQTERAVDLLEDLIDQYPNSNPGRLGEEQLQEFADEGLH